MDKVYIVFAARVGYSQDLYGVYTDRILAENRIEALKQIEYTDLQTFEIVECILNKDYND